MSDKPNIYQRLHMVMEKVDYVQKEKKKGMNYTIVSHDAVTAKVRPALHAAGVVYHPHSLEYVQDGNRTQVRMVVRFVNIDDPNDFVDVPCLGFGIDNQDKGPGKAVSYAVKYALLKALGLETGDDPDEDTATPAHDPKPEPTLDEWVGDIGARLQRQESKEALAKAWTWVEGQKQYHDICAQRKDLHDALLTAKTNADLNLERKAA